MSKQPLPQGGPPPATNPYYQPQPAPGYAPQGVPGYGAPPQGAPGYGAPPQGAPGYGAPPQGAPGYGPPPQQYPTNQPQVQKKYVVQPKKGGILGSVTSAFDSVSKDISREIDLAGNAWNKYAHQGAASELFGNHNVLELISRSTGRPLQIVMSPSGQLVVDANGAEGQFNAAWTVVCKANYVVHLHNNFNYLAVRNGHVVVEHYPQGQVPHGATRFRVIGQTEQFVVFENVEDSKSHIGFGKDGILRNAQATGRDIVAHFAVKVLFNAGYGKR